MVPATAQGVRLVQSKLRYHTQDYSYSLFSFVRGKEVWRMIGATELLQEKGGEFIEDKENKKLYVRILSLLKRLLPGEEKNEKLFEVVSMLYAFLNKEKASENRELIEIATVLRILHHLGYIREKTPFESVLQSTTLNPVVIEEIKKHKTYALKEINNALKESQL